MERERIISDERAGRRTLWVSIGTAVISAAAAIGVALIAHIGGGGTSVAKTYKDLVECRESLNRLSTLAGNQQQTLNSLRDAVGRSIDSCSERLEAAIPMRALTIALLLLAEPAHAAEHRSIIAYICKAPTASVEP